MAADDGRRRPAVSLREAPRRFALLAAVRALEAEGAGRVRFRAPLSPVFPPGDVEDVRDDPAGPVIETAVMALFGPEGPMPSPIGEAVRGRARAGDPGPRAFFDLFGDRLARLLVDLMRLERPAAAATEPAFTPQAAALRALAARADPATEAPGFDRDLLCGAALLHRRPAGLHAAGRLIAAAVGAPTRVRGLVGGWTPLATEDRTRLGAARLGATALGGRVWLQEGRVAVEIGPLPARRFAELLPGGPGHARLAALARHALPPEPDIDVSLTVAAPETPAATLGRATRLGWSSWLAPVRRTDQTAHFRLRGAA